jgi:hypothetical protein
VLPLVGIRIILALRAMFNLNPNALRMGHNDALETANIILQKIILS